MRYNENAARTYTLREEKWSSTSFTLRLRTMHYWYSAVIHIQEQIFVSHTQYIMHSLELSIFSNFDTIVLQTVLSVSMCSVEKRLSHNSLLVHANGPRGERGLEGKDEQSKEQPLCHCIPPPQIPFSSTMPFLLVHCQLVARLLQSDVRCLNRDMSMEFLCVA